MATLLDEIEKEWARFSEVQATLKCGRNRVGRLIRDGVLEARKLGREKWILRQSVRRYLDSIFKVPPAPVVDGRKRRKH